MLKETGWPLLNCVTKNDWCVIWMVMVGERGASRMQNRGLPRAGQCVLSICETGPGQNCAKKDGFVTSCMIADATLLKRNKMNKLLPECIVLKQLSFSLSLSLSLSLS